MKWALAGNSPLALNFYRYLFSVVIVLIVLVGRYRRPWRTLFRRPALLWLGVFNFAGSLLQLLGIARTTSTKTAVLTQLLMVVVPIFAYWILRESVNRRKILGILFSISGAIFLSTNLDFANILQRGTLVGDLLVIAADIFWALFIVYSRKWAQVEDVFLLLAASQVTTFVFCLLGVGAFPTALSIDFVGLAVGLFLATACTIIPTLLYNYSLRRIDATTSTIFGPVELITAVALAYVFLGDRFTLVEALGTFLILISIYIITWRKPSR